jgi:hypothetical protein
MTSGLVVFLNLLILLSYWVCILILRGRERKNMAISVSIANHHVSNRHGMRPGVKTIFLITCLALLLFSLGLILINQLLLPRSLLTKMVTLFQLMGQVGIMLFCSSEVSLPDFVRRNMLHHASFWCCRNPRNARRIVPGIPSVERITVDVIRTDMIELSLI